MEMGLFGLPYFPIVGLFRLLRMGLACSSARDHCRANIPFNTFNWFCSTSVFPDRLATDKIVDQQQASAEPSPFERLSNASLPCESRNLPTWCAMATFGGITSYAIQL
jgi:hypothetical protein